MKYFNIFKTIFKKVWQRCTQLSKLSFSVGLDAPHVTTSRCLRIMVLTLLSGSLNTEICPIIRFLASVPNGDSFCFSSSLSMSWITWVAILGIIFAVASTLFGWPRTTDKCSLNNWRKSVDICIDPMFWLRETSTIEPSISTRKSLWRNSANRTSSSASVWIN